MRNDEKGNRQTLLVVKSSRCWWSTQTCVPALRLDRLSLDTWLSAVRCALARLGRIVWWILMQTIEAFNGSLAPSLQYSASFRGMLQLTNVLVDSWCPIVSNDLRLGARPRGPKALCKGSARGSQGD